MVTLSPVGKLSVLLIKATAAQHRMINFITVQSETVTYLTVLQ